MMTSIQQHLNECCQARLPEVNFNPTMTVEEVREEWTEPLLVHMLASGRLRQDIDVFVKRGPYSQNGSEVPAVLTRQQNCQCSG